MKAPEIDLNSLQERIRRLTRKMLLGRSARHAELHGISHGSLYYEQLSVCESDFRLMRRIDELQMDIPFAVSQMVKRLLIGHGLFSGRSHVAPCMKRMGVQVWPTSPLKTAS